MQTPPPSTVTGLVILLAAVAGLGTVAVWRLRRSQPVTAKLPPQLSGFGYTIAGGVMRRGGTVIGPIAGATAEVVNPQSRYTLTRVATVAGALTQRTTATLLIYMADGRMLRKSLAGRGEIDMAHMWVAQFNRLAEGALR